MSWNLLWWILPIFALLIFGIIWFAKKGRKKSSDLSHLQAPKKMGKKATILIGVMIFLLLLGGLFSWWFLRTPKELTPQQKHNKEFIEQVLPNVKEVLDESVFVEKIENHEIEIIYGRYRPEESGAMIEYYFKIRGKEGFYLVNVRSNFTLNVNFGFASVQMTVDTYMAQVEEGVPIYAVPTNPKYPRDMSAWLFGGVFLVVFILVMWLVFGRMMRGGGFTKAQLQEAKKPVYFEDIGGVDEALDESREVAEMIKSKGGSGKW